MSDYILEDGKGTTVRESVGDQEGYVDIDLDGLSAEGSPLSTDYGLLQRGTDDPKKVLFSVLSTLVKSEIETADTYDEIWVGAGAMVPSETNGAEAVTVEYGTNDMTHDVMRYMGDEDSASTDTHAEFDIVMPPSWDRGTIKAKVYWTAGGDANPDEDVEFYIAAGARSNSDPLDAVLGTAVEITDKHITDDDLHITAASAAITVGGTPALGDLVHLKLSRDFDYVGGGSGDAAMDVDADVLGVLIQYKRNQEVSAW